MHPATQSGRLIYFPHVVALQRLSPSLGQGARRPFAAVVPPRPCPAAQDFPSPPFFPERFPGIPARSFATWNYLAMFMAADATPWTVACLAERSGFPL